MNRGEVCIQVITELPLVMCGIKSILNSEMGITNVVETTALDEAYEHFLASKPNMCVIDLLPSLGGLSILQKILRSRDAVPVLAVACHSDPDLALRIMKEGATGIVSQSASTKAFARAVDEVMNKKISIEHSIAQSLAMHSDSKNGVGGLFAELTQQEYKVCVLLMEGVKLGGIARKMNLANKTVANYKTQILHKMNVQDEQQLLRIGIRSGLINV